MDDAANVAGWMVVLTRESAAGLQCPQWTWSAKRSTPNGYETVCSGGRGYADRGAALDAAQAFVATENLWRRNPDD